MLWNSLVVSCNLLLIILLCVFLNCPLKGKFCQLVGYIFLKLMQLTKRLPLDLFTGFNVNNLKW